MKPETTVWVEDAEYDLQSAKVMLDSGRYFFVVFMCHLTIEKLLKSVIVERQGIVVNPEGVLAARLPFRPEADKVRVRDKSGTVVAETDVRSLVLAFCRRLQDDPECAKALRDR